MMANTAVATSTSASVKPRWFAAGLSCLGMAGNMVSPSESIRAGGVEDELAPPLSFVPLDEDAQLNHGGGTELGGRVGGVVHRDHDQRHRAVGQVRPELVLPLRQ